MSDIQFSDEAKKVMENFISGFPAAIRESYKNKITKGVEYQLLKKGLTEVTKDIFIASLEETLSKSFEPIILRCKDPQKLSAMVASQKEIDEENPLVKIRRWKLPPVKSDAPLKNVCALMAGPRKHGNTDCILEGVLDGVRELGSAVEKLYISDLNISPCIGCMTCERKELETYCAIKDDMTDLYLKFLQCDAFVMGFPVYTARECGQAAIFFDRLKALRSRGHYQKLARQRKGALVVTWGWPTEDAYNHVVENAVFVLKLYGVDTSEIVTGCGFWEAYYKKGTATLDKKGLEHAREAGRALVS